MLTRTSQMSTRDKAAKVAAAWEIGLAALKSAMKMASEDPENIRLVEMMDEAIGRAQDADAAVVGTLEWHQSRGS